MSLQLHTSLTILLNWDLSSPEFNHHSAPMVIIEIHSLPPAIASNKLPLTFLLPGLLSSDSPADQLFYGLFSPV